MRRVIIDPREEISFLPTRRTPPKKWKLEAIAKAFESGQTDRLPDVIIFERKKYNVVADGNHRILLAIKHDQPIAGVQLSVGEEFLLRGNPRLNYGRRKEFNYQNFGLSSHFIDYCRAIALTRGYKTFSDLFSKTIAA